MELEGALLPVNSGGPQCQIALLRSMKILYKTELMR
jgi:hypothetical protein